MPAHWNPFNREEQHVDPEIKPGEATKPPEKTPAELIAESVGAAVTEAFKPITAKLNEFDTRLAEATKKPEPRQQTPEHPETPSVLDNEDLAFATRLTPFLLRQYEVEAKMARNEIKSEYVAKGWGDVWAANEAEISAVLDGSPVVGGDGKPVRGNLSYIRNVVDMVIGRAAQKAGLKFGGKDRGFFVETAGGESNGAGSGPVDDGLTADQRRVFNRMKVPLDKAKETVSKLKFVN